MSSSPLDPSQVAEANDPHGRYRRSILAVDDLLEKGLSLSGHERNVCFLNLARGDGRFATVSAISGIDFDDDARALAPVDWDGDGDLDLWISNRTAPMLRFLKNTHAEGQGKDRAADWLQVKLEAAKGARDAIGARVTLELAGGARVVRVLKAGEGFLTQSSKWLHFGLGPASRIERVRVRWPGRGEEMFGGLKPGGHFVLAEGAGVARSRPPAATAPVLEPGGVTIPAPGAMRAVAGSKLSLPRLPWESFGGQKRLAGGSADGLTLVNLWATWCAPCVTELQAFAKDHGKFQSAGVQVLALSVDGLAGEGEPGDPEAVARRWNLPFPAGRATASLVRRVEQARAHAWGVKWPLPVPASLLLDSEGRLAVLYLGPVSVDQVVADARRARESSDEAWHDGAVPYPGPWIDRPTPPMPMALALDLMNEGALDDAREFVARAKDDLSRHKEYGTLLVWIADRLMGRGETRPALDTYAAALAADESNVPALNNLAWQLATHKEAQVRRGAEAVRLAEKAHALTGRADPSIHDTLAAAYAEAGRYTEAVSAAERGLELALKQGNAQIADSLRAGLSHYRKGRAYGR